MSLTYELIKVRKQPPFYGDTCDTTFQAFIISRARLPDNHRHSIFVVDQVLTLDVYVTEERLKMAKKVPLSQVVDWSLLKEIKDEKDR